MRRAPASLRRRLRDERGFTLIELLTVLGMLGIVIGALATVLMAATRTEDDLNRRFGAQINARLALDQLRREIHCASSVTPAGASSSITIVLGNRCPSAAGGATVTWCTSGSGTRYALYRAPGSTCSTSLKRAADYLTTGQVFTFTPQSASSLATLSVTLPVNPKPASGLPDYRLQDDIVLRNSTRA